MKILIKVLVFFLVNAIGYYVAPSLFALLVLKFDMLDYSNTAINKVNFEQTYFLRTLMTWGICAVFSFAGFFFKSSIRFLFLLAPIFVPLLVGAYYIFTAA